MQGRNSLNSDNSTEVEFNYDSFRSDQPHAELCHIVSVCAVVDQVCKSEWEKYVRSTTPGPWDGLRTDAASKIGGAATNSVGPSAINSDVSCCCRCGGKVKHRHLWTGGGKVMNG